MKPKHAKKPKLTDEERHKRFIEVARKVEASDDPEDFDRALKLVAPSKPAASPVRRTAKPTSS
jgi:hypothetical protein